MPITRNLRKSLLAVAACTAIVLVLNAIAMQFTPEVSWGLGDFVAAGVLLFGAGASVVMVHQLVADRRVRFTVIGSITFALTLVWAELAVGLFH